MVGGKTFDSAHLTGTTSGSAAMLFNNVSGNVIFKTRPEFKDTIAIFQVSWQGIPDVYLTVEEG